MANHRLKKEIKSNPKYCLACQKLLTKRWQEKFCSRSHATSWFNKKRMTIANKEKISKALKGRKLSEEHKQNISACQMGSKNNMWGRTPVYPTSFAYKSYQMRSSWEVKYAEHLDSISADWKYETRAFDLGKCTYTPDFFIYENGKLKKIVEIKGFETRSFKEKWKLFQNLYPEIFKITELVKNVS